MDSQTQLLGQFVKDKRKSANLTQADLSAKTGVGLRFIRELENGKMTLKMDKVNQVLNMFGHELMPMPVNRQKK